MFADVVQLYRASGRPEVVGGRFAFEGEVTPSLTSAIANCSSLPSYMGFFEAEPDEQDGQISFEWKLSANESGRFYADAEHFAVTCESLGLGVVPTHYYLVAEDVLGGVDDPSIDLLVLVDIARLIECLSKLSFATSVNSSWRRLLFVLPAGKDAAPRTIELDTRITAECLKFGPWDLTLLCALTSESADRSLHVNEHRQLFRTAVATILSRRDAKAVRSPFEHLLAHWDEVMSVYQLNADCYVQNFSFERMKGEVGKIELDYATRVSAVLGDSSSKLLALPLSVAGIVAVMRSTDVVEVMLLILGMMTISLIVAGVIHNQLLAASRVEAGFALAISDLEGGGERYPESLVPAIAAARVGFTSQLKFLRRVYWVVRPLAWIPPVLGTAFAVVKYGLAPNILVAIFWCCGVAIWVVELSRSRVGLP